MAQAQLTEYHFGIIDFSAKRMPELLASARENIDHALRLEPDLPAPHSEVNAQLGRIDEAIKLIERLHAMPNDVISVWELKLDPTWDPLRGDPRFEKSSPHSLRKNSKAHPGRSRERSHARRCLDKFLPDIRAIRWFP